MSAPFPAADRLDQAVAEFLAAVESGSTPDRAAFVARYEDLSADLARFFADHDRMAELARPVRCLLAQGESTSRPVSGDEPTIGLSVPTTSEPGTHTPERIGDYEILRELGRGGMGVVYQARHVQLQRVVALKMVLAGQFARADDLDRFREEARSAAALEHSGIVSIYETGQCLGQPYFTMAYVEGPSLARVLEDGPLPPQVAARLMRKIVAAVAYAHAHGIIHRDLKPANILLEVSRTKNQEPRGAEVTNWNLDLESWNFSPKVSDFGLAKRLENDSRLTASGQLLGTPSYMSPEQAGGRIREAGPAADIYSLGAILYAMLAGRPPFTSDNPVEVILQVLEREPELLRRQRPEIPCELEWICLKCLEKQPADRYATAPDLAADLDRFLRHEPVEAKSPTAGQRFRRWMRRQPVLAWHLIGLAVPLVLTQVIFALHPRRDLNYHVLVSGVLVLWMLACGLCQWLMDRPRSAAWSHYFWSAADCLFLTALLALISPPRGLPLGPLVGSYLVLVGVSGLFFQLRLVVFTTAMTMVSYLVLCLLMHTSAPPLHYAALFETSLLITGFIVGYQVWRMGVLREYYEDRK
jgi:serine/threonine-protein kinase